MSIPSPFIFTKHGLSYRVELDAHYISDEEMQTLRRYITTLNDENAKLREQIHWLKKGDVLHVLTDQEFAEQQKHEREMQASIKALDDENAKLRELVRDMNKWLWNGADCTECPFAAKCDLNAAFESDLHANVCLGWSEIHRRMRELGVDA